MQPKIGADLKLTFPIRWAERTVKDRTEIHPSIWAFHTPISRAVFEANYRAISAAYLTLFSKGIGFAAEAGPIIGTMALRDAARADAIESGSPVEGDPATPLLAEINRLTMILAPTAHGYDPLPVDVALKQGIIDRDEWDEAEASIVFFTCGSWMSRRETKAMRRDSIASVLKGSITSSDLTEFVASLATSTKAATSEHPRATRTAAEPLSIPS